MVPPPPENSAKRKQDDEPPTEREGKRRKSLGATKEHLGPSSQRISPVLSKRKAMVEPSKTDESESGDGSDLENDHRHIRSTPSSNIAKVIGCVYAQHKAKYSLSSLLSRKPSHKSGLFQKARPKSNAMHALYL